MAEIADQRTTGPVGPDPDAALQSRVLLGMGGAVAVAIVLSALLARWRVTAGLFLGGSLSLFNYHWMRRSIAALIEANAQGHQVSAGASRYLLRYVVIAVMCAVAYQLNLVSLAATIAGLCSFVVALLIEALRQFYFAVIHREETS